MPGTHGQLMKKGVNFSGSAEGGTQSQDISYSDFENLTQAQKDNGTIYFIPDYPLPTVAIKPWATATDAELVAMVQAADAGDIDLYEDAGWHVGDERVVHLSAMSATGVGESHAAQDVTFVLMHQGLYKDTNNKTVNFVVGMKNCLIERGKIDSLSISSWESSERRTWCNNIFKNAIPSTIRSIFKQVNVTTAFQGGSSTNVTTDDYFFLPAEKEVFGAKQYSNQTEADALIQFDYYKTSANRIKTSSGTAINWWLRSPYITNSAYYCNPTSAGAPDYTVNSNTNLGISVHGCI